MLSDRQQLAAGDAAENAIWDFSSQQGPPNRFPEANPFQSGYGDWKKGPVFFFVFLAG